MTNDCPNIRSQSDLKNFLPVLANSIPQKTLLIHSCCGPCSSTVLERLSKTFKITIFFYNPNIDTEEEFEKRYEEQTRLIKEMNLDINVIKGKYDENIFLNAIKGYEELGEKTIRCYKCYYERMNEAALIAKKLNFDYFTTTLSISPHKNSNWINEIGIELENKYQINFLYSNFKLEDGYKRSIELSKEHNLYRQDYCGCKYSKKEAYERRKLKNID
ncbi:MAG: epoxyqueuosine reductase QueH [Bacilli bacterium]|nr:epoxyqueuosine reductase QueH [Bacilli bacterium]